MYSRAHTHIPTHTYALLFIINARKSKIRAQKLGRLVDTDPT